MYINKTKMTISNVIGWIQIVVGVMGCVVFGGALVSGLAGDEKLKDDVGIAVVVLLPFIWMVYLSIQKRIMRERTRELNQIFCLDADGNVPAAHLKKILHMSDEQRAIKAVQKLIRKGYLKDCTVEPLPEVHVVLYHKKEGQAVYETATCPKCGGSMTKRAGYVGVCPFCGTKIK